MKLTAIALAGGLLLAGSAFAAEPNDDAAKIIQQIQERQAAKVEAAAKSAPAAWCETYPQAPGGACVIGGQGNPIVIRENGVEKKVRKPGAPVAPRNADPNAGGGQ